MQKKLFFKFSNCGEEYTSYLAFIINEHISKEFAAGFMSRKWFDTLQFDSETLIQADATFYFIPKQFYQLLNIFFQYKSYSLPAFHILMSRKSSSLLEKIILKVKEILPFTASRIIADLEEAMFQAFPTGFPEPPASGCLFHYKKATYKTGILKNGLSRLFASNEQFNTWAQHLMNLPLLHSDEIMDKFYLKVKVYRFIYPPNPC